MKMKKDIALGVLQKIEECKNLKIRKIDTIESTPNSHMIVFRLKGTLRKWRFAIIVREILTRNVVDIDVGMNIRAFVLAEYNPIDEKPNENSVTGLCVGQADDDLYAPFDDFLDKDSGLYMPEVWEMLLMVKKHPFMAYAGVGGRETGYFGFSFIRNFVRAEIFKRSLMNAYERF